VRALTKAFQEYGEDIKEFQWLVFKSEQGQKEFPYEKKYDPFIQMGWMKKQGESVIIEDGGYLIDKVMDTQRVEQRVIPKFGKGGRPSDLFELVKATFVLPTDIHVNETYQYQLSNLVKKFGEGVVRSVCVWYTENKDQLDSKYSALQYRQAMSHAMFDVLVKWMNNGIDRPVKQEVNYRDRVC